MNEIHMLFLASPIFLSKREHDAVEEQQGPREGECLVVRMRARRLVFTSRIYLHREPRSLGQDPWGSSSGSATSTALCLGNLCGIGNRGESRTRRAILSVIAEAMRPRPGNESNKVPFSSIPDSDLAGDEGLLGIRIPSLTLELLPSDIDRLRH